MSAKVKQYNSLDLMKLLCALLIIIVHTSPFRSYSTVLAFGFRNIIGIIAVPFFFSTSGFLLFKKLSALEGKEKSSYFKHYIKRLCVMYGLWSLVYFPFVVYNWCQNGFSLQEVLQYIKRFFFEGSYNTIWFLPALITAAALCYFLHTRFSFRKILWIALPFYLFACLLTNYYGITEAIPGLRTILHLYYGFFDSAKNGLLFGFVFVALGGFLAEFQETKSIRFRLVGCGVFGIALAAESVLPQVFGFKQFGCDIKLFLLPFTFCLMTLLLQISLPDRKIYFYARKISLMLFLSQRIFISLADIFLSDTILVTNSALYFFLILSTTWIFSDLFIRAAKKVPFLKYFC